MTACHDSCPRALRRAGAVIVGLLALRPASAHGEPADDHGALQASSTRFAEAQRRLDGGDHDGAIALLERGLAQIPEGPGYAPTRARMLLLIVEAHGAGFRVDGDLGRLRRARLLLDRYLGPLDLLDEQGRGEAEEQRSRLIGQISDIEAARRRADAERAAAERAGRAEAARKRARTRRIAGVVTTSLGLAGLGVAGAGIGVGVAANSRIAALTDYYGAGTCSLESAACEDRYHAFQVERRRGNAGNILFAAGASAGGALLVTGVVLLLVARKMDRNERALRLAPAPAVSRAGFGLVLIGRF